MSMPELDIRVSVLVDIKPSASPSSSIKIPITTSLEKPKPTQLVVVGEPHEFIKARVSITIIVISCIPQARRNLA